MYNYVFLLYVIYVYSYVWYTQGVSNLNSQTVWSTHRKEKTIDTKGFIIELRINIARVKYASNDTFYIMVHKGCR